MGHSSKRAEGTEGWWVNMGHGSKESPRQRELKAGGLTWDTAARRAGCWVNMGHGSKESTRQRELKAGGLTWDTAARRARQRELKAGTWDTAARRAQDRGN